MPLIIPTPSPRRADLGGGATRRTRLVAVLAIVLVLVVATVMALTLTAGRSDVVGPSAADPNGGLGIDAMPASAAASSAHEVTQGSPPLHLDLYTDYTDPDSARFASVNALVIQGLAQQGIVSVWVHPLALDEVGSHRDAAVRAGNAVACVGEHAPKDLWAFHVGLLAMQPSDGPSSLESTELIAVARDSGVDSIDEVSTCITTGSFNEWIEDESEVAVTTGVGDDGVVVDSMPLVLANGVPYQGRIDSSDEFRSFLDAQLVLTP